MIIDSHVHIFPDSIAPKAVASLARHAPHPMASDGTLGGLLSSMAKGGINKSVILPVSTKPEQVPGINCYALRLNQNPGIIAFGALHPDFANFRDEIKRLKDSGIQGVKMHPDYQAFDADEKRLLPLYEALAKAGLILYLHAGENVNIKEKPRCTPEKLANIVNTLPQLKLIAAHLGGWSMWDDVERRLIGTPIFLDTSFTLGYINADQFLRIIRAHGVDKIIFGSDFPWNDPGEAAQAIRVLPLSDEEKKLILGKNAARLLSLPMAPS